MNDLEKFELNNEIKVTPLYELMFGEQTEQNQKLAKHRAWLQSIRRERPAAAKPYRVGVYIRYYNQTKYENYLEYHKKQYSDTIALCPKWTLVDFYVDEGGVAPNMESSPEWCRLLADCMAGEVDLIITQKVSNVSRKPYEITLLSRMLAAQEHPVGIYFISEDLFTLASYYLEDMRDMGFFLEDWQVEIEDSGKGGLLSD